MSEGATSHTTDKFVVFDNDIDTPAEFVIMTDAGERIATVHASDRVSAAEAKANAYLFAAAPKLQRENERLRAVTQALVAKLTEIEADTSFQGAWSFLHVHGYKYSGPDWRGALADARAVINR